MNAVAFVLIVAALRDNFARLISALDALDASTSGGAS